MEVTVRRFHNHFSDSLPDSSWPELLLLLHRSLQYLQTVLRYLQSDHF